VPSNERTLADFKSDKSKVTSSSTPPRMYQVRYIRLLLSPNPKEMPRYTKDAAKLRTTMSARGILALGKCRTWKIMVEYWIPRVALDTARMRAVVSLSTLDPKA
jgi:hypothetical protein